MEIGNQIKSLRLRKGVTQEAMARHFGVSPQAVSKWERGTAAPDIAMLPALSAYFGVTIDELFALSDDTRMERIQNMLWDVRYLNAADVENARAFLLEKARREPENGHPHTLLADMENCLARAHREQAAEYAKEALRRDHTIKAAHSELTEAMGGAPSDWCVRNHYALIDYYKGFVASHPDYLPGYLWLLDQLIQDNRMDEARHYLAQMAQLGVSYHTPLYRGLIALREGDRAGAMSIFAQMQSDYPYSWQVWLSLGDVMADTGEYEKAKTYYRRAMETQTPPRYTDGLTSIAQICEIQGDWAGAIAAHQEEITLLADEWDTADGETVDQHRRAIARLKARLS